MSHSPKKSVCAAVTEGANRCASLHRRAHRREPETKQETDKKDLIINSARLKKAQPQSMHTVNEVPTGQHYGESSHTFFLEISMTGFFSEVPEH